LTKRKALTEEQWLSAKEPNSLLSYLQQHRVITRVPGGRRRLALFSCACCRLVWHLFDDEASRRAVEVSELAAEGQASRRELAAAADAAAAVVRAVARRVNEVHGNPNAPERWKVGAARSLAAAAYYAATRHFSTHAVSIPSGATASAVLWLSHGGEGGSEPVPALMARQAQLVRCIFANPFCPLPEIDRAWLTWNGGAVRKLAVSILSERRFGDLPVLADALEEAGCADAAMLRHCRDGGEHALGCWVLDLLQGKGKGPVSVK
jgi:hypothetical protein